MICKLDIQQSIENKALELLKQVDNTIDYEKISDNRYKITNSINNQSNVLNKLNGLSELLSKKTNNHISISGIDYTIIDDIRFSFNISNDYINHEFDKIPGKNQIKSIDKKAELANKVRDYNKESKIIKFDQVSDDEVLDFIYDQLVLPVMGIVSYEETVNNFLSQDENLAQEIIKFKESKFPELKLELPEFLESEKQYIKNEFGEEYSNDFLKKLKQIADEYDPNEDSEYNPELVKLAVSLFKDKNNNSNGKLLQDIINEKIAKDINSFEKLTGVFPTSNFEELKKHLDQSTLSLINRLPKGIRFVIENHENNKFNPESDTITIDLFEIHAVSILSDLPFIDMLNAFVSHEVYHGLTEYAILSKKELRAELEIVLAKVKQQHKINPFIDRMRFGYEYGNEPYTFKNISEMVTDFYSNPYFQTWLKSNNFWDRLLELITSTLSKLGFVSDKKTFYDELSSILDRYEIENINYKAFQERNFTAELKIQNAIGLYNELDDLMEEKGFKELFEKNLDPLKKGLKKIREKIYEVGESISDPTITQSLKQKVEAIIEIEENPEKIKNIFNIIKRTDSVFALLRKKMEDIILNKVFKEDGITPLDINEKLRMLYDLKEVASQHDEYLKVLDDINDELLKPDSNLDRMINTKGEGKDRENNKKFKAELIKLLTTPKQILSSIERLYLKNYKSLVTEIVYNDLEPNALIKRDELLNEIESFKEKRKTTTSINKLKAIDLKIEQLNESIKNLPIRGNNNFVEDKLNLLTGDINWLNANLESATISASVLSQSLSSMLEDNELKTQRVMAEKMNMAQEEFKAFLQSQDSKNIDLASLSKDLKEEYTIIDSVVYIPESKTFEIKSHKQKGFIDKYSDEYQYELSLFDEKIKALMIYRAGLYKQPGELPIEEINDIESQVEDTKKDKREFYKNNVDDKLKQEVIDILDLRSELITGLDSNGKEVTTTLFKFRGEIFKNLEEKEELRSKSNNEEEIEKFTEEIELLRIEMKSVTSLYGKSKDSIEYKVALKAKEYAEKIKDYRETYITPSNQALFDIRKKEIEQRKLKNDESLENKTITQIEYDKFIKNEYNRFYEENSTVVFSQFYWDTQTRLKNKVDELRKQLVENGVFVEKPERIKQGDNVIRDISKKYRDNEGIIDGNLLNEKDNERQEIKEIEEELESLKKELRKLEEEKNNIELRKANKQLISDYKKTLKELFDLSEGATTEYYDTIKKELDFKKEEAIKNFKNSDEYTEDNPIKIGNMTVYKKDGVWGRDFKNRQKTIVFRPFDEERLDTILDDYFEKEIVEKDEWFLKNHFLKEVYNEDIYEYEEKYTPLYHWRKSVPKDKSHIKTVPSFKYSSFKYKDNAFNPNHIELPNGMSMPKVTTDSKYLNKRYQEVISKPSVKRYLDYLKSIYYSTQDEANNELANLGNLFPSVRKSSNETIVKVLQGNIFENLKEAFTDTFRSTEQDVDNGYIKKDSVASKIIPTYLIGKIEAKDQSDDILGMILQFTYFNERRKGLLGIKPFAESLFNASAEVDKKIVQTESGKTLKDKINAIKGKIGIKEIIVENQGVESNQTKKLRFQIDSHIYGQTKIPSGSVGLDKSVNALKAVTSKSLFFLNVFSPLKNTISAKFQQFINGEGEQKEWLKASSEFVKAVPSIVLDLNKIGNRNKVSEILTRFQGEEGNFYRNISSKTQANMITNLAKVGGAMKNASEFELMATFTILKLQQKQVKYIDPQTKIESIISLYEAYTQDKVKGLQLKKGVQFTQQEEFEFIKKIKRRNLEIQGAYRMEEKNNFERTTLGSLAMFMNNYLVSGLMTRFRGKRYLRDSAEESEGFYRMAFEKLIVDYYKHGVSIKAQWDTLTVQERRDILKFLKEISLQMIFIPLLIAAMGGGNDDRFKDKSSLGMFSLAIMKGVQSEVETFNPIKGLDELNRKFSNPFIVSKTSKNIRNAFVDAFDLITPWGDSGLYEKKSGIHDKGDVKLFSDLAKLSGFSLSNLFFMDSKELLKRQEQIMRMR